MVASALTVLRMAVIDTIPKRMLGRFDARLRQLLPWFQLVEQKIFDLETVGGVVGPAGPAGATGAAGAAGAAGATGATGPAGAAGSSATEAAIVFSCAETLAPDNLYEVANGDVTSGTAFFVRPGPAITITGIRFYWMSALGETVKCGLYTGGSVLLASANVVTSGVGFYTATFATPYSAIVYNRRYITGVHDIAGGKYTKLARSGAPSFTWPARPFFGGRRIGWMDFGLWVAGDAGPTSSAATEVYPVDPVFQE